MVMGVSAYCCHNNQTAHKMFHHCVIALWLFLFVFGLSSSNMDFYRTTPIFTAYE